MDKETKIKKIRGILSTWKRQFAESHLDDKIPGWRELEPEWQSITRLSPESPEYRDQVRELTLIDHQLNQEMLQDVRKGSQEYRTFVPKNIDLSNKELKIKVQDEIKNLLEEIRASVNVYPEDTPQHMQEHQIFQADKPQEVRLQGYPLTQKLVKSFIVDDILKGGGRQLYEPRQIEQFLSGTKQFYEESTDLTTEGTFDVNIVNEFGFSSSPAKFKKFLKDLGIVGQSGFSRDLREILRYFTGTFEDTGLNPISATYKGRNPELYDTLKSLPFLESVGEGRFIVKLLTRPEDNKTTFSDATDLVPVYEKFMGIKPRADRTLPEQMQHIEDMRGTGTVRSMIDPSQQTKPLETQEQSDIFRHLLDRFVEQENKSRQERQEKDPELTKRIEERREHGKKVTFLPDPELKEEEEEEEILEVPKIPPIPRTKPKPSVPVEFEDLKKPTRTGKYKGVRPAITPKSAEEMKRINDKLLQRKKQLEQRPKPPDPKGGGTGVMPLVIPEVIFEMFFPKEPTKASLEDQMNKLTG